jgi:hypothetical protein
MRSAISKSLSVNAQPLTRIADGAGVSLLRPRDALRCGQKQIAFATCYRHVLLVLSHSRSRLFDVKDKDDQLVDITTTKS